MSKSLSIILLAVATAFMSSAAQASLTGDPLTNAFGWVPNSANALNYAQQTPGRVGQVAPFVLFDSATYGSVTLNFNNGATGLAFFEIRIDGIHTGGVGVSSGTLGFLKTINAASTVDVRLALGGERDWDFDWVRFEVAPVPEPTTFFVWSVLGVCAVGLRRNRHAE
jgi:hypothetical protein